MFLSRARHTEDRLRERGSRAETQEARKHLVTVRHEQEVVPPAPLTPGGKKSRVSGGLTAAQIITEAVS